MLTHSQYELFSCYVRAARQQCHCAAYCSWMAYCCTLPPQAERPGASI